MSDLDKTIEELEAEVTAELEEAADAPKKGAPAAEKGDKVEGDVEDLGAPVVKGDEKKGPDAAKKIKKDTSIPTAVKGDEAPQKLKEEDEEDDEEDKSDDSDKEEMDEMEDEKPAEKIKSKKAAINAMVDMMNGMKADDAKAYAERHCKDNVTASYSEKKEALDIDSVDVSDDVKALVEGEDLSEEFQTKAATIFEAAVKSKLRGEVERLEMENTQTVAEEIEAFKKELTEKVDSYLDYVVKEWMQENELAIDRGLKGEIAEDFITGLKALFEEHYIDVPDEKYDVLEGQAQKIEELESKLNETIEKMTAMNKEKSTLVREQVIAKVSTDLAETEKEKFEGLVEDVEFADEETFTAKLNTLKENYFPKTVATQTLEEEVEAGKQEVDVSGAMAAYMSAITKTKPYEDKSFNIVKK